MKRLAETLRPWGGTLRWPLIIVLFGMLILPVQPVWAQAVDEDPATLTEEGDEEGNSQDQPGREYSDPQEIPVVDRLDDAHRRPIRRRLSLSLRLIGLSAAKCVHCCIIQTSKSLKRRGTTSAS